MKKLDSIRSSQSQRHSKKELKEMRQKRSKRRRSPAFRAFVLAMKIFVILLFISAAVFFYWIYNQIDFAFGDNLGAFDMRLSSTVYCPDEEGNFVEYDHFKSSDNRIWVDIDKVPKNLQNAFVAIEDQRFYQHQGVDLKRTMGAVLNVFVRGDSSYGGSTITQQLVKNITNDAERTNARKLREMTRSIVLETKMSKKQILELYMNSIYLSQGVHGVEAAANVYFDKTVGELTLAECASIAGITQYPTTYDPIINPKNNKKKQLVVLAKMLELGYINQSEYNDAINEELVFRDEASRKLEAVNPEAIQSYFMDYLFEQSKADLKKKFGYTDQLAENMLYNGGLKIYATVNPKVQSLMESFYMDDANFQKFSGSVQPESAMIVCDPSTGQLRGIVGGRGVKTGNRVLNRATQSKRQPGSTIKPIAVYAPALENNIINLATYVDNSKLTIGKWTPTNSNNRYSGPVSVKTAVASSINVPAVRVLEEVTVDKSYDYVHNKLHMTSIVESETKNGDVYSDKNLPSLALGGLTNGVTPLEMTGAYMSLANGGMYTEPVSYTKIYDKNGKLFFEKKPAQNRAFSKETAFLMQQLLNGVVKFGTAAGSEIQGMETCGKTGTTDDNKDKWFIGFTPYYCGTVWFGFDNPKVVNTASNPALAVWKKIMPELHKELEEKSFEQPSGIEKAYICGYTGLRASAKCGSTEFANKKFLTGYCKGVHKNRIGTPGTTTSTGNVTTKAKTNTNTNTKTNTKSSDKTTTNKNEVVSGSGEEKKTQTNTAPETEKSESAQPQE